jgi:hypothetical protein
LINKESEYELNDIIVPGVIIKTKNKEIVFLEVAENDLFDV